MKSGTYEVQQPAFCYPAKTTGPRFATVIATVLALKLESATIKRKMHFRQLHQYVYHFHRNDRGAPETAKTRILSLARLPIPPHRHSENQQLTRILLNELDCCDSNCDSVAA